MKSIQIIGSLAIVTALGLLSGCSQDDAAGATAGGASGNDSSSGNNGQIGNSQQTGKIAADGFYFLFSDANPIVIDEEGAFTQQQVDIIVFADDINDLEQVNGWTVSFKTEWGTFLGDKDSCVLENGQCSVTWSTGAPATVPGNCHVAFTAWAVGEEAFFDSDDNGLVGTGEFVVSDFDVQEPFLDVDENGVFSPTFYTAEGVGELIDIVNFNGTEPGVRNGVHDFGNGLYDGSFCESGNPICSGRTSVVVHYRSSLPIAEPQPDENDFDSDGDTEEEIYNCTR